MIAQAPPATTAAPPMRALVTKKKSPCCSRNWQNWPSISATLVKFSWTLLWIFLLIANCFRHGNRVAHRDHSLSKVLHQHIRLWRKRVWVVPTQQLHWFHHHRCDCIGCCCPRGSSTGCHPVARVLCQGATWFPYFRLPVIICLLVFIENDEGQQLSEASWCLRNYG